MLALAEMLAETPGGGRENTDRVRPIGEVLTCLLSRYQISAEVTPLTGGRPWVDALPEGLASADMAELVQ